MSSDYCIDWRVKITLEEKSESEPSIVALNNRLYLVWRGRDEKINMMRSTDGIDWGGKVIVEEKKLAPSVYAYSGTQEIAGTFEIVLTGVPTTDLTEAENATHEAFERFETDGFTTADLERLKAKYETGFYSGNSSVLGK